MTDINLQPIHETDWDYLIILDACRYDYFKEQYKNYDNLKEGKLEKRKSRGSSTPEWLVKTFPDFYDYIYFSTNMFVNDQGKSIDVLHDFFDYKYKSTEHFKKIVDLYTKKWDPELRTVHPKDLNEFVIKRTGDTKIRKTVIHYMQPHTPYLKDTAGKDADNKLRKIIRNNIFWRKLPLSVKTKIKETLGLRIWPSQKAELGKEEKIRELYEENLEIVLNYVNELINYLEGKIVITSDHGERLGENGEFFHEAIETDNPVLREVPWLEIEKDESGDVDEGSQEELDTEDEKVDEEELKRKLEALGYKT